MDNFCYIKGKAINPSDSYVYIKNPLLSENEIKNFVYNKDNDESETNGETETNDETETSNEIAELKKILYIDTIHIGQFINFGYKGSDTSFSLNFRKLVESLSNHFIDIAGRISDLQDLQDN